MRILLFLYPLIMISYLVCLNIIQYTLLISCSLYSILISDFLHVNIFFNLNVSKIHNFKMIFFLLSILIKFIFSFTHLVCLHGTLLSFNQSTYHQHSYCIDYKDFVKCPRHSRYLLNISRVIKEKKKKKKIF